MVISRSSVSSLHKANLLQKRCLFLEGWRWEMNKDNMWRVKLAVSFLSSLLPPLSCTQSPSLKAPQNEPLFYICWKKGHTHQKHNRGTHFLMLQTCPLANGRLGYRAPKSEQDQNTISIYIAYRLRWIDFQVKAVVHLSCSSLSRQFYSLPFYIPEFLVLKLCSA